MTRIVLLFCALVLLAGLGQDGCFGKVRFSPAPLPVKTSLVHSNYSGSGNVNSQDELPPAFLVGINRPSPSWPAEFPVPQALKIIGFSLLGSSGGIPWETTFRQHFAFLSRIFPPAPPAAMRARTSPGRLIIPGKWFQSFSYIWP